MQQVSNGSSLHPPSFFLLTNHLFSADQPNFFLPKKILAFICTDAFTSHTFFFLNKYWHLYAPMFLLTNLFLPIRILAFICLPSIVGTVCCTIRLYNQSNKLGLYFRNPRIAPHSIMYMTRCRLNSNKVCHRPKN